MTKDDDDDQTVLMLAASTGDPHVLRLVASRLPRVHVSAMHGSRVTAVKHVLRICRYGHHATKTKTLTPSRIAFPLRAVLQLLELVTERCVRGNLVVAYAVKTGEAAMIEAALDQFPPDQVGLQVAGTDRFASIMFGAKRHAQASSKDDAWI